MLARTELPRGNAQLVQPAPQRPNQLQAANQISYASFKRGAVWAGAR